MSGIYDPSMNYMPLTEPWRPHTKQIGTGATLSVTREPIEREERMRYQMDCVACDRRAVGYALLENVDRRGVAEALQEERDLHRQGKTKPWAAFFVIMSGEGRRFADAHQQRKQANAIEARISSVLMRDLRDGGCPHTEHVTFAGSMEGLAMALHRLRSFSL